MTVALPPSGSGPLPGPGAALRILWLTTSADTDGPGRVLLTLLKHWRDHDVVTVRALRTVNAAFRRECPSAIDVRSIGMRGAWDVGVMGRLIRDCRAFAPDVIHTQLSRADWIGRVVGRVVGVPVVSTIHNVHSRMYRAEFGPVRARAGLTLDRLTTPLVSRFVAVSDGVRRDLEARGVPADRIAVVHNAFDARTRAPRESREALRQAWGVEPDVVVVGTIALLKPQKGIRYLVEAARAVVAANPKVRFVHAGDGPLQHEIEERIRAAGLDGRFRLLGRVPDAAAVLAGIDIFALPSLWEGLPMALLEAMAAGLPAIGTRVSGIEEAIDDHRTGLLIPPADSAALTRAILDLSADPDGRRRFGRAAAERLSRFEPARAVAACRQVYIQILSPSGAIPSPAVDSSGVRKVSNM